MSSANLHVLCVHATAFGLMAWMGSLSAIAVERASRSEESRLVCGPRSVQFVLSHYGTQADLIELIKEIQWPRLEDGCSLDQVSRALTERGLYTDAIEIGASMRICSEEPVIVHMKPSSDDGLGHYLVWLPTSDETRVRLWDGLNGELVSESEEFARLRSGVILLVSNRPIPSSAEFVQTDWKSICLNGFLPWALPTVCIAMVISSLVGRLPRIVKRRSNTNVVDPQFVVAERQLPIVQTSGE